MIDKDKSAKAAGAIGGGVVIAAIALATEGATAAGMTSSLAAAGSLVGGGMAAGIGVTAAAPLAVGVAVYGLYKLIKD